MEASLLAGQRRAGGNDHVALEHLGEYVRLARAAPAFETQVGPGQTRRDADDEIVRSELGRDRFDRGRVPSIETVGDPKQGTHAPHQLLIPRWKGRELGMLPP